MLDGRSKGERIVTRQGVVRRGSISQHEGMHAIVMGKIVVDTLLLALVNRDDQRNMKLAGLFPHHPDNRTVRYGFGDVVPARLLFSAEIRTVENLLQTDNLGAGAGRLANIAEMFVHHRLRRRDVSGLN